MKRTPADITAADLPRDVRKWTEGAASWNSSCSDAARVYLLEKDGGYFLETDLFDALASFRGEPVDTARLGKAFQPDQAFENPDGSPITFDVDYNGRRRESEILPGPFAVASRDIKVL